jgi:HK97 family phage major capsid protein
MALKALMLRRRIDLKKKELNELRTKLAGFAARETELETAIGEVETEEQRTAVEEEITAFEQERDTAQQNADQLESEIAQLEGELQETEAKQNTDPAGAGDGSTPAGESGAGAGNGGAAQETINENRGGKRTMRRTFAKMNRQERDVFFAREDVKSYLSEIRTAIKEKRAISGAGLTIPDVMLEMIRETVAESSKLLPFITVRNVGGKARQNIAGTIPEAVWTEMCAKINELDIGFNQIEVDGYKVAAFIPVCNAVLEDNDVNLADEIVRAIGVAIAKALDKAILFGKGTKMPLGIVTRLAQTSEPADWDSDGPAWTDLHTSNVQTLNIASETGVAFFTALIEKLGLAKPKYSSDGLFWVMNRKTHIKVMIKALAFNANAALVSNTTMMPVLGGTVVEFEDDEIADDEIIGGFGGNYLMAERAGLKFASSDIPLFLEDQTVFKGTARYDGKPVAGEAFVIVNFANTSPTTTRDFAEDYANRGLNDLTLTAAAGSAAGKTVVTVSGTVAQSNPDLMYKVGKVDVKAGDKAPAGFADLTSGTTAITAAAGKVITVIELDGSNRVISAGQVISVPQT